MSIYNPDLTNENQIYETIKSGKFAALIFMGLTLLGAFLVFFTTIAPAGMASPTNSVERVGSVVGILTEAALAGFSAWRFHVRKGYIAGIVLLLLVALEFVIKLMSFSVFGAIITASVGVAIFHATRASLRLKAGDFVPNDAAIFD